MSIINDLIQKMISYETGEPKRIQHFLKVHSFSKMIGKLENIDEITQYTLEIASIVHDIGIKPSIEKYGSSAGKFQEKEGPAFAEEMLDGLGLDRSIIDRVCYLVGHHHTYTDVDGLDYQILIEADFLVNLFEDEVDKKSIESIYKNIFKTRGGKQICKTMFSF